MSNIDDLIEYEAGIACPQCGGDGLNYIPKQSGACHSGLFVDTIKKPFYYCYSCETPMEIGDYPELGDWCLSEEDEPEPPAVETLEAMT